MRLLRKLFGVVALAAVAVAAAIVVRRRVGGARARVDLYYDDGSMATFEDGSGEADRLLGCAREAFAAVRPA